MGLGEKNPYELIRIMYMKKITINAFSEKEAREIAIENNLPVVRNVTPSWLKAGSPAVGTDAFYEFATAMMKKTHLENTTGAGLLVVEEKGSTDTRKRPYNIINNVTEGTKKYETLYEVRRKEDGYLIGTARKKKDAMKLAKKAMVDVKADMECRIVKVAKDNKDLAFTAEYVPSTNTKTGTYTVFGNERF